MTQLWTIVSRADPASVIEPLFVTDAAGQHPKDKGLAWNADTMLAKRIDARPDLAIQRWSGSAWVDDSARLETTLVSAVKAEGERLKMLALSAGGAKKAVYAMKAAEIEAWRGLATLVSTSLAAFLKLALPEQRRRFRFTLADGARRGDPDPSAAIARFQAGADAANVEAARLEAIEQAAVSAIRAAATAAAKRAAFATIDWSWRY